MEAINAQTDPVVRIRQKHCRWCRFCWFDSINVKRHVVIDQTPLQLIHVFAVVKRGQEMREEGDRKKSEARLDPNCEAHVQLRQGSFNIQVFY